MSEPEITAPTGGAPVKVQELPTLESAAEALHANAQPPEATEPEADPAPAAPSEPEPAKPDLESQLAKEREKFEARQREIEWREKQVEQGLRLQELARKDPYAAYKELGIPLQDLLTRIQNDGQPDPVQQTQSEVSSLKEELGSLRQELAMNKSLAKTREVMAKSEKYKLLQALGREEAVARFAMQNGNDYEAAVNEVLELVEGDLRRLEDAGLISRGKPVEPKAEPNPVASESVTLNSALGSSPSREPKRTTPEDDFQRFIQGIQGSFG